MSLLSSTIWSFQPTIQTTRVKFGKSSSLNLCPLKCSEANWCQSNCRTCWLTSRRTDCLPRGGILLYIKKFLVQISNLLANHFPPYHLHAPRNYWPKWFLGDTIIIMVINTDRSTVDGGSGVSWGVIIGVDYCHEHYAQTYWREFIKSYFIRIPILSRKKTTRYATAL